MDDIENYETYMDGMETPEAYNDEKHIKDLNASNEAERLRQQISAYNNNLKKVNNLIHNNGHNDLNNGNKNNNAQKAINNNKSVNNDNTAERIKSKTGNNSSNSALLNKGASAGLQAAGIPQPAADAIVNSKLGQKAIEKVKQKNPMLGLMDRLMGGQKQEKVEENTMQSVFEVPTKVIKWSLVAMGPVFAIVVFCCLFISASQVYLNSIGLGNADNVSNSDAENKINSTDDSKFDNEIQDTAYIEVNTQRSLEFRKLKLQSNLVQTEKRRPYNEANLEELADYYSDAMNLSEDDSNVVYDFFFKMMDLYNTYKKRNVELDLPLLMATLRVQSTDMYEVFSSNLSDTDKGRHNQKQEERDMSNFEYEKDWSSYVTTKQKSEHDMEVLAQNMVSNKATETCTDANGKVTKENVIMDNEIGTVVLKCDEGETYKVTEAKLEEAPEKYREFLKQFLEKKYFLTEELPLDEETSISSTTGNNQQGGFNETEEPNDNKTTKPNQTTGDFRNWKQCGESWSNMLMPGSNKTMCQWGCFVTSLSIQIARSGTYTKEVPFNPGVALKYFKFSGGGFLWGSQVNVAPNFVELTNFSLSGMTREAVIKKLNQYNKTNLYMILKVKKPEHYVAVDYIDVENNKIYILDPGKSNKNSIEFYEVYGNPQKVWVYEKRD